MPNNQINILNEYEQKKKQKSLKRKENKLTYKELKLLEDIEKTLPILEQRKENLVNKLSSGELSNEDLLKQGELLQMIITEIEQKEMIWLELNEKGN